MEYIFLVIAVAWSLQFLLSYLQLQRFHRRLAELRKLGRYSVGKAGSRWRGRTYAVVVLNAHDRVLRVEVLEGLTFFAHLRPVAGLDGMNLDALRTLQQPPAPISQPQWLAIKHAADFFKQPSIPPLAAT
jgi:DNA-binding transcriptional regulator of glucitol operon